MTAFGPMIIDMYLPALPEAQHQFRSSTSEILTYIIICNDRFSTWTIPIWPII